MANLFVRYTKPAEVSASSFPTSDKADQTEVYKKDDDSEYIMKILNASQENTDAVTADVNAAIITETQYDLDKVAGYTKLEAS